MQRHVLLIHNTYARTPHITQTDRAMTLWLQMCFSNLQLLVAIVAELL